MLPSDWGPVPHPLAPLYTILTPSLQKTMYASQGLCLEMTLSHRICLFDQPVSRVGIYTLCQGGF